MQDLAEILPAPGAEGFDQLRPAVPEHHAVIRVGTRGSALALAQANSVGTQLGEHEIVVITTSGDRGEALGDKSRWTSALERAR